MSTLSYRLTVVGCALLWLLVGLHMPVVHQIVDHGRVPSTGVLALVVGVAVAAVAVLLVLLRAPAPGSAPGAGPGAAA